MRVRIHRGAAEIGGNCIEVAQGDDRVVLDLGRPLSASADDEIAVPPIDGVDGRAGRLLGVVLSHPHLDHYGLVGALDEAVPVYMGAEAERLLAAASFFSPMSRPPRIAGHIGDRTPLVLGPFTITPFLVDHSAFDAYSLLVEAGGRRLFYSGDVRAHGRKAALFERLVADPPSADVMLMEGTNIRRDGQVGERVTESDVEMQLADTMRATTGLVATLSSAQNIDRLVTVFRAARRTGRVLLVDLYTASVAAALGRASIPQPGFDGLAVFVPQRQRVRVKQSGEFDRVRNIAGVRVFPEQLVAEPRKYAFYGASSAASELVRAGALAGGAVVWSLWSGYLREPSGRRLIELLAENAIPLVQHHTSGHAHVDDLRRLAEAMAPARVVPIHSEATDLFERYVPRVERHPDGEWWEV